ncbi:MAG TPA: glycerophosphodiester phosphodiesterase [Gaiellaceae bacterium]|nr:glycerophosphodiester phosphodiesterase [Gaiellaceae bacterium]
MRLRADGRPLRVGHKGAAALEPENTLRSIRRAVELGCDLVEFDVLDLHDGTLVLAHSDDLFEVSHGAARGQVRRLRLEQLREVAPELPTLDEALDLLSAHGRVGVHVDLKWHGYEDAAAAAIRRHGVVDRSVVSTVHAHSLRRLASIEPRLARGYTYPFDRRGVSGRRLLMPVAAAALAGLRRTLPLRIAGMLERARASAAMLYHGVVSRAAVERAHDYGAAVFAWTVDDEPTLERVIAAGVDAVVTNDPRIFGSDYTQKR